MHTITRRIVIALIIVAAILVLGPVRASHAQGPVYAQQYVYTHQIIGDSIDASGMTALQLYLDILAKQGDDVRFIFPTYRANKTGGFDTLFQVISRRPTSVNPVTQDILPAPTPSAALCTTPAPYPGAVCYAANAWR